MTLRYEHTVVSKRFREHGVADEFLVESRARRTIRQGRFERAAVRIEYQAKLHAARRF
jgi:hypothetical protein